MTSKNAHDSDFFVSPEQIEQIRRVPYFCDGPYKDLDIQKTLEHFRDRYILNAPMRPDEFAGKTVSDIGCGFGWLAMAYAIWTEAKIIAVELDVPRLEAGRQIAEILGLTDAIDWRAGSVTAIPLEKREATLVYCIEVLEHVQRDERALQELQRVADSYIVLTTPNLFAPVIGHDTRLPFCHWLPFPIRDVYARLFGRQEKNDNNLFWSPMDIKNRLNHFSRISNFLHYNSIDDYLKTFPYYSPYVRGGARKKVTFGSLVYLRMMSMMGHYSFFLMHNLAGTFRRV